jgi:hypothetical protein
MSFAQNSVSFGKSFEKSGQKPAFSIKSKVAFPKTEVLGKPLIENKTRPIVISCKQEELLLVLPFASFLDFKKLLNL